MESIINRESTWKEMIIYGALRQRFESSQERKKAFEGAGFVVDAYQEPFVALSKFTPNTDMKILTIFLIKYPMRNELLLMLSTL
jgi:hypothetical protein